MVASADRTPERTAAAAPSPLIDVRKGEAPELWRAFFTLLGLVAALSMLETARDALFLAKLPAQRLALVYAVVAALGIVVTRKNLRLVERLGQRNSLVLTLALAAVGTTWLYFRAPTPVLAFGLYVWSALIGSVAVVQFWLVANAAFTSAQSKRLFPLIAAGGVIGAVVGSALAVIVLTRLPVDALLPMASALFVLTAIAVTTSPESVAGPAASPRPSERIGTLVRRPYLLRIALSMVVSTIALLLLDYLFKSRAAATLPKQELGPFFARYYAILNGLALFTQVVLAAQLVRRMGVAVALSVLPVALLGGSVASLLLGGGFSIVLMTKGADGALRHSLHRVANELLYVPLDSATRHRIKPLVDSVLARASQAAGALLILALALLGADSEHALALILAVLALVWVGLSLSLRAPYLDAFRATLARGGLDDPRIGFDDLDLTSVEAVTEALSSPEPERVIAAMNLLADAGRTRLIPALILYHESSAVLARALEVVPDARRNDWAPLAQRLLDHPEESIRLAAVRALTRQHKLTADVQNATGVVRAYVAAYRLREAKIESPLEDPEIQSILGGSGSDCRVARGALLEAVIDEPTAAWAEVVEQLASANEPELAGVLPRAMAALQDERFVEVLIQRLSSRRGRVESREALAHFGDAALAALGKTLLDSTVDRRVRLQVPRAIAAIGTVRAARVLESALTADVPGLVRYRVLRALGQMVSHHGVNVDVATIDAELRRNLREHLKLAGQLLPFERELPLSGRARASARLVAGLLTDKLRQAKERAFRLLQLLHPSEDLRSVYFALESSDPRTRANALEFVEALTLRADEELRTLLRLVVDDLSGGERAQRSSSVVGSPPESVEAALVELMADSDDALATVAAYHAHALERTELAVEAEGVMSQRGWMNLALEAGVAGGTDAE